MPTVAGGRRGRSKSGSKKGAPSKKSGRRSKSGSKKSKKRRKSSKGKKGGK